MFHSTTILALRLNDRAVMAGDGQVTFGNTVMKHRARKIRKLYHDRILAGFAGSAADSFALFSRFESKLEQYRGQLERSAVELAKDWRTDRALRRLEAMLVVMDKRATVPALGHRRSHRARRRHRRDRVGRAVRGGRRQGARGATARSSRARLPSSRWRLPPTSASTPTRTSWSRNCEPDTRSPVGAAARRRGPHAAADRRRARQVRRRPAPREARRRDRAAQPHAAPEAARPRWPRRSRRRTS